MRCSDHGWIMGIAIFGLAGCATLPDANDGAELGIKMHQAGIQEVVIEQHLVKIRDLSDPCDPATVPWNLSGNNVRTGAVDEGGEVPIHDQGIDCNDSTELSKVSNKTPHLPDSVTLEKSFIVFFRLKDHSHIEEQNRDVVNQLESLAQYDIVYEVFGAAGVPAPSELATRRANTVKALLVEKGVLPERIIVMPYDPALPGLRAIIRIRPQGEVI